ncbi:MAG: flavin reductase family protein [Planctomycetes bacterium]|nr:flavin reductase family protein [Planctomycetota bacterium]
MAKQLRKPSEALYPVPVVLVTCADKAGKANMITLAWVGTVCSQPPMISISIRPSRYSHPMVKDLGEFVVNIPTAAQVKETDYAGIVSGRDVDKFAKLGFTPEPASKVKPPLIQECPVNIECKVRQTLTLGTHDMFIGEVVAVHVDESVLTDKGRIDVAKAAPFAFAQGEYWSFKDKIGSFGFSGKK